MSFYAPESTGLNSPPDLVHHVDEHFDFSRHRVYLFFLSPSLKSLAPPSPTLCVFVFLRPALPLSPSMSVAVHLI